MYFGACKHVNVHSEIPVENIDFWFRVLKAVLIAIGFVSDLFWDIFFGKRFVGICVHARKKIC